MKLIGLMPKGERDGQKVVASKAQTAFVGEVPVGLQHYTPLVNSTSALARGCLCPQSEAEGIPHMPFIPFNKRML